MNNEPVAWINKTGSHGYLEWDKDDEVDESIPLYTNPVKEQLTEIELEATFNRGYKEGARDYANKCNPVKELTDEEILPIYTEYSTYYDDQRLFVDIYGFARAILRKAQEK